MTAHVECLEQRLACSKCSIHVSAMLLSVFIILKLRQVGMGSDVRVRMRSLDSGGADDSVLRIMGIPSGVNAEVDKWGDQCKWCLGGIPLSIHGRRVENQERHRQ